MSDDLTSPPTLCDDSIASGGFRLTRQRREVYGTLLEKRDHPSAVQVFTRVQQKMPSISLATVYNCLETLTHCGLVRQVNFDRGPSRFCANTHHHAHFICTQCGAVHDVELPEAAELERVWRLPEDYVVTQYDFSLRGLCRACSPTGSVVPAPVSDPTKK
jgi:Fur family peroxide stress response transcriptional regulator